MSIIIHISGGNVQSVFADSPCHVLVIDEDNLQADGHSKETIAQSIDQLTARMEAQDFLQP